MSKDEKCTCKACKTTVFHCQICKFVGFCCRRRRGCLSSLAEWGSQTRKFRQCARSQKNLYMSLNNKIVHRIMRRSSKREFLISRNPAPHSNEEALAKG